MCKQTNTPTEGQGKYYMPLVFAGSETEIRSEYIPLDAPKLVLNTPQKINQTNHESSDLYLQISEDRYQDTIVKIDVIIPRIYPDRKSDLNL